MTRNALANLSARAIFFRVHSFALSYLKKSDTARHLSVCLRAQCRHPFVPPELSLVAHCTVHRPQCPIRRSVRKGVPPVPLPGHMLPDWCAIRHFFRRPGWHARAANAAIVSNISPPVCGPRRLARSSRWIACAPAYKTCSTPRPCVPF
jgi:hypothetical protein